ncbi:unnamed protein product [Cuscuta epithymum]|uniref:Clp R domain-containing protein n=1 Tax=Cuscuta epithymum TaxID=186058 RepID=A0AAV0C5M2_9ASTE|nr:unnamed protein product [Cuscuta epithymum]
MAAHTLSYFSIPPSQCCKRPTPENSLTPNLRALSYSFLGRGLSFRVSNLSSPTSKRRSCTSATLTPTLPSSNEETAEKAPSKRPNVLCRWSARAIKSFAMGELEARKLRYLNTGTESLLMGILVEGTSLAAKHLRENGITLFKVRDETINLLGKSGVFISSPEHPPLTKPAKEALDWAVDAKLKSGEDGELTTAYLLLGIWSQKESAGQIIMATLGFDDEKANELSKFMDKDIIMNYR